MPLALALHLRGWGLDCVHVLDAHLGDADDAEIWAYALAESRIVVSKDEDFIPLALRQGDAGRLLWVRLGNCRNAPLLAAFDRVKDSLLAELRSTNRIIELR